MFWHFGKCQGFSRTHDVFTIEWHRRQGDRLAAGGNNNSTGLYVLGGSVARSDRHRTGIAKVCEAVNACDFILLEEAVDTFRESLDDSVFALHHRRQV